MLVTERKNFIFNRNEHASELQERGNAEGTGWNKKKNRKAKKKEGKKRQKKDEEKDKARTKREEMGEGGGKEFAAKLQNWSLYYLVTG